MTRYACSNPGCPRRAAVTAEAAPTCYTCGGAMAQTAETRNPLSDLMTLSHIATQTANTARPSAGLAPMCMACRKQLSGSDLRPQICEDCRTLREALPRWTPTMDTTPRIHKDDLTSALAEAIERDAYMPWGGPAIIGFEPTPEQRASCTLPPITIEVAPPRIDDPEAFVQYLREAIVQALTDALLAPEAP